MPSIIFTSVQPGEPYRIGRMGIERQIASANASAVAQDFVGRETWSLICLQI